MIFLRNNFVAGQRKALKNMCVESSKKIDEVINATKSKTLEELYTDEFRPAVTRQNLSTVKNIATGEPVPIQITLSSQHVNAEYPHEFNLRATSVEDPPVALGVKSFGMVDRGSIKFFSTGYVESFKNNDYAGTQIRLLQAQCELAKQRHISSIPLVSLVESLKFHTSMGFRPTKYLNEEVKTLDEVSKLFEESLECCNDPNYVKEMNPIISEHEGRYFYDRNRTFFNAILRHNLQEIDHNGVRQNTAPKVDFEVVDMELSGKELKKWEERIKGFEILTKTDINSTAPKSFVRKIFDMFSF